MKVLFLRTANLDPDTYLGFCEHAESLGYEVTGFLSTAKDQELSMMGAYPVYPATYIDKLDWDIVLIPKIYEYAKELFNLVGELISRLGLEGKQMESCYWLLKQQMRRKYEDVQDPAIQGTLEYWKTHELSVFNQYFDGYEDTYDEVFIDESCGLPYINFRTDAGRAERMYFPKSYHEFTEIDGKIYKKNILEEQRPTSPHLYLSGDHRIDEGDILIDAGVCEGNFALRFVDVCSKIYLFESDPSWFEPLRQTFKDYGDKVELITRRVSEVTGAGSSSIDDALPNLRGHKIFLKMDIEGAEVSALRGAKNLLRNNRARVSVCAYHHPDDLWKIKSVLQGYGYETSTSDGYMVFYWDPDIWKRADFRKGLVRASNY